MTLEHSQAAPSFTRRALIIEPDYSPEDPRENQTTDIWHPNTSSININTQGSVNPFDEDGKLHPDIVIAKPIYLHEHSGRTVSLTPFSDKWDSGQLGFIYLTRESFEATNTPLEDERLNDLLQGDIDILNAWLQGRVYRFSVEDHTGTTIDSVGNCVDLGNIHEVLAEMIPQYISDFPTDTTISMPLIKEALANPGTEVPFEAPYRLWDDDLIQFARLLNEIELNLDLTDEQFRVLEQEMDLTPEQLQELFDRAQSVFDASKARV